MYLKKVNIENIKSLSSVSWEVEKGPGWHVITGYNGSGKSCFLQAIALAMLGSKEAAGLRLNWDSWLQKKAKRGAIELTAEFDSQNNTIKNEGRPHSFAVKLKTTGKGGTFHREVDSVFSQDSTEPTDSTRRIGWFSAAFGPMRRFSGGTPECEDLSLPISSLSRHLSLFEEQMALTKCLAWLRDLRFCDLTRAPSAIIIRYLISFINQQGLLPDQVTLDRVTTGGITFMDANRCEIDILELSDGCKTVLSIIFEILRLLADEYGPEIFSREKGTITVNRPGVVLIDEIEAHLHPTWQRQIGKAFCKYFPHIQFIVSSHSPLVCQADSTVFRLPKPASRESGEMITGIELN